MSEKREGMVRAWFGREHKQYPSVVGKLKVLKNNVQNGQRSLSPSLSYMSVQWDKTHGCIVVQKLTGVCSVVRKLKGVYWYKTHGCTVLQNSRVYSGTKLTGGRCRSVALISGAHRKANPGRKKTKKMEKKAWPSRAHFEKENYFATTMRPKRACEHGSSVRVL